MKEANTGNYAPNSGENFEKEYLNNIQGLLEHIKAHKEEYYAFLIESQSFMLRHATEAQYDSEYIDGITSCVSTIQQLVLRV